LWFDEYYSEELYKAQSAMTATYHGKLVIVCGTSGSTNLPLQMMQVAHETGACVLDINPDESPFSGAGEWWQCTAVEGMTRLLNLAL
jgi:NAD-dependent SIR2 family protein deacetylase